MTKALQKFGLMLSMGALCACTPGDGTSRGEIRLAAEREQEIRDALPPGEQLLARIGSLPRQELMPGTCGLFLWTRVGGNRKLVVHQQANDPSFTMRVDGRVVTLPRTIASGQSFYGVFTTQIVAGAGITAKLNIVPEKVMQVQQGAQITQANLRVTDDAGWDVTMPTAGLVACQPREN